MAPMGERRELELGVSGLPLGEDYGGTWVEVVRDALEDTRGTDDEPTDLPPEGVDYDVVEADFDYPGDKDGLFLESVTLDVYESTRPTRDHEPERRALDVGWASHVANRAAYAAIEEHEVARDGLGDLVKSVSVDPDHNGDPSATVTLTNRRAVLNACHEALEGARGTNREPRGMPAKGVRYTVAGVDVEAEDHGTVYVDVAGCSWCENGTAPVVGGCPRCGRTAESSGPVDEDQGGDGESPVETARKRAAEDFEWLKSQDDEPQTGDGDPRTDNGHPDDERLNSKDADEGPTLTTTLDIVVDDGALENLEEKAEEIVERMERSVGAALERQSPRMDDGLFVALLDVLMSEDPRVGDEAAWDELERLADEEAQRRGHDGWIHAYHESLRNDAPMSVEECGADHDRLDDGEGCPHCGYVTPIPEPPLASDGPAENDPIEPRIRAVRDELMSEFSPTHAEIVADHHGVTVYLEFYGFEDYAAADLKAGRVAHEARRREEVSEVAYTVDESGGIRPGDGRDDRPMAEVEARIPWGDQPERMDDEGGED